MASNKLSFREAVQNPDMLSITWELVPGRGAWEKSQENTLKMAELAAKDQRINGITITDNPGGKPAILAYALATETEKLGIESIIHFTCKDKNRNDIESELYALARSGAKNLLVMTGDYPSEGYEGLPKPVFDIDSVQALRLIENMNKGQDIPSYKGRITLKSTSFFAGAVVSPFKRKESEILNQYYKLHKKVESGAKFIITQLGYDARKFDELKKYISLYNLNIPLIGNIYVLTPGAARLMNRNEIPGCVVTGDLMKQIEVEKCKYGKSKEPSLLRSAKLYAILKGLKYDGINISGHGVNYEDVVYIMEKGEELSPNWQDLLEEFNYPLKSGFYFFEKDNNTGLNSDTPVDRSKTGSRKFSLKYRMFSLLHKLVFEREAPFYKPVKLAAQIIDNSVLKKPFTLFEYLSKTVSNECRFCGDCAMHDLGFICPMSQCPKQQRNGQCGGSYDGWCEVYPGEKKCIYVTIYEYFKSANKEDKLQEGYIPPCNWKLFRTSSWLNYFNGRDYSSINNRENIKKKDEKNYKAISWN
ncbi:MAG: methylenetetrahydrofolate reductase C-terminal domain-containing protein [Acetivibrionales bacterium]|jgi:methylenetetrahydrofolate reductase (NADPH)